MRITTQDTLAIIVDMQEKLYPHMAKKEELKNNMIKLIKGLQELNIPILLTQQYTKGLGSTIDEIKDRLSSYQLMEKNSFSCCDQADFNQMFKSFSKKNVIIAGIEAHICIQQSVIDLLAKKITTVVVEDCISSRKLSDKKTAITRMQTEGALMASYESILFELCRSAKNESFKVISNLVK